MWALNAAPVFDMVLDQSVSEGAILSFFVNASDADNDPIVYSLSSTNCTGSNFDPIVQNFTWAPDFSQAGIYFARFKASDGTDEQTKTVAITANNVNRAPVAVRESYLTGEDTGLKVPAPGVLSNDYDDDGDKPEVSVLSIAGLGNGKMDMGANGSFTYTPNGNWSGEDWFTYSINDGLLESNRVNVTITVNPVNDAPEAVADAASVDEDNSLTVPAPGVLGNDLDIDTAAASLSAVLVSGPANGALALNSDGSLVYTPNANWSGADSFSYKANDGALDSNTATATVTVNSVNDAPTFNYTANQTVNEGALLNFTILADDADSGDALTYAMITGAPAGASFNAMSRELIWKPAHSQSGKYAVNFTVTDGNNSIGTLEVGVTVNNVPTDEELAADRRTGGGGGGGGGFRPNAYPANRKAPETLVQESGEYIPSEEIYVPGGGAQGRGGAGAAENEIELPTGPTGFAVLMNAITPGRVIAGLVMVGALGAGLYFRKKRRGDQFR